MGARKRSQTARLLPAMTKAMSATQTRRHMEAAGHCRRRERVIQESPEGYRARAGCVPKATTPALARASVTSNSVMKKRSTGCTIPLPSAGCEAGDSPGEAERARTEAREWMVTRGWIMDRRRGRGERSTAGVSKPPGRGRGGLSGECRMAGVRLTIWNGLWAFCADHFALTGGRNPEATAGGPMRPWGFCRALDRPGRGLSGVH